MPGAGRGLCWITQLWQAYRLHFRRSMVRLAAFIAVLSTVACGAVASTTHRAFATQPDETAERSSAIARAQVWTPTNVRMMNLREGPAGPRAFTLHQTVNCTYSPKDLSGKSPKFSCISGQDELKVKFGEDNAEVFAEVAATRLMWALGFGADAMYSVRVICRDCPSRLGGIDGEGDVRIFDPATIERKMPGREFEPDSAWSWRELNSVDPQRGGAPLAHRDALKLLAVFMQHTDTKPRQQRIMCLEGGKAAPGVCEKPFLMISDVGLTFGRANLFNSNSKGMDYVRWSATPVWKESGGCVGNLSKSATGTLDDPVISEEGRAFLANLLMQLSDDQIAGMFEAARVTLRLRDPGKESSGLATVGEWVEVFKRKRAEIVNRKCA